MPSKSKQHIRNVYCVQPCFCTYTLCCIKTCILSDNCQVCLCCAWYGVTLIAVCKDYSSSLYNCSEAETLTDTRFAVPRVVTTNITVFWDLTACSLVSEECAASIIRIEEALMVKAVCFRETLVPDCTVSHPTKQVRFRQQVRSHYEIVNIKCKVNECLKGQYRHIVVMEIILHVIHCDCLKENAGLLTWDSLPLL